MFKQQLFLVYHLKHGKNICQLIVPNMDSELAIPSYNVKFINSEYYLVPILETIIKTQTSNIFTFLYF